MTARSVLISGLVLLGVTAVAIFTVDGALAALVQPYAAANRNLLNPIVTVLEIAFGFPISKFATGMVLILAALLLFASKRLRGVARPLLFVGVTHLTARLLAGVLKNVFLRARPPEGGRFFVEEGSSFPSGHAVHFWALFFALAIAFPKLRIPALALALFVSVARVAVNDHYASDVVASAAIAALVSYAFARPFRMQPMPAGAPEAGGTPASL